MQLLFVWGFQSSKREACFTSEKGNDEKASRKMSVVPKTIAAVDMNQKGGSQVTEDENQVTEDENK